MSLTAHIQSIESLIGNPGDGLPEALFQFVSRLVPMVNADLLIRNDRGQCLLSWRDDAFYGPGWHIPGGIVRFKERIEDRIHAIAASELGAEVEPGGTLLAIHEIMSPTRDTRGHFISLLYRCELKTQPDLRLRHESGPLKNGQWAWHDGCPPNLIPVHDIYRPYITDSHLEGMTFARSCLDTPAREPMP